jgi:tetratricopeptide (TPR) repeat protein
MPPVAVFHPNHSGKGRGPILIILRSRKLWIILGALLFLGISGIGARWAYGKWINRQSWSLAALAETQLREGRVDEALMSLDTSLRLRPDNPLALRQLALTYTATGQRQKALAAWQKLSESNQLTAADAAAYGMLAGVEGEWALANHIIDSFNIGNKGPESDLLRANISSLRGDIAGTEASLRKAVEKDSTPRSRATLADFLLSKRLNSSTRPEILALHRDLITLPDETGANALAAALQARIVPDDERAEWIASLREHPKASPAHLLAADSAEAAADPAATPLLAAKVSARLANASVAERRLGFLWLGRHNQPARALRLITRDETLADPTFFAAWIEALADTGKLPQILETLDLPANPLPPARTALYRGRTLQLLGRPSEADTAYQAALAASANSTTDKLAALAYIQDAGETALFETEVQKLLADPTHARNAYESLLPVVAKRRDISAICRLHELALASPALPQKTSIQNEIDYCDLVLDRPVDGAEPEGAVDAETGGGLREGGAVASAGHLPTEGDEGRATNHGERTDRNRLDERNGEEDRGEAKGVRPDALEGLGERNPLTRRVVGAMGEGVVEGWKGCDGFRHCRGGRGFSRRPWRGCGRRRSARSRGSSPE